MACRAIHRRIVDSQILWRIDENTHAIWEKGVRIFPKGVRIFSNGVRIQGDSGILGVKGAACVRQCMFTFQKESILHAITPC
jgi:hypothetical protein